MEPGAIGKQEPNRPRAGVKICPECKKRISEDAIFCSSCGYTFDKEASAKRAREALEKLSPKNKEDDFSIGRDIDRDKVAAALREAKGEVTVFKNVPPKPAAPVGKPPQLVKAKKDKPVPEKSSTFNLDDIFNDAEAEALWSENEKKIESVFTKPAPKQEPEKKPEPKPKPEVKPEPKVEAKPAHPEEPVKKAEEKPQQEPVEEPSEKAKAAEPMDPENDPVFQEALNRVEQEQADRLAREEEKGDQEEEELDEEARKNKELRAQRIKIKDPRVIPVKVRAPIVVDTRPTPPMSPKRPVYPPMDADLSGVATPDNMVLVPAGEFLCGTEKETTALPAFFVDIYPVTCEQYLRFCEETNHPKPPDWVSDRFIPGRQHHPVTMICVKDARAYAKWVGKRLLTELEWEKAAGGTDGRLYPWGDEYEQGRCICSNGTRNIVTAEVNAHPDGASPVGCFDMVGNAAELTESIEAVNKREALPVIRGGSVIDKPEMVNCRYKAVLQIAELRSPYIGFRCAKDIELPQ